MAYTFTFVKWEVGNYFLGLKFTTTTRIPADMVKRKLVKLIYSSLLPDTPTRQCKRRETKLGERCCVTLTLISKLAVGDLVQSCQEKKSIVWRFVAVRVVMDSSVEACQSGCVVRFPNIQQPISSSHLPCLQRIIERVTALVWKRMQLNSLLNPKDREKMRQRRMRHCKMTHFQTGTSIPLCCRVIYGFYWTVYVENKWQ